MHKFQTNELNSHDCGLNAVPIDTKSYPIIDPYLTRKKFLNLSRNEDEYIFINIDKISYFQIFKTSRSAYDSSIVCRIKFNLIDDTDDYLDFESEEKALEFINENLLQYIINL